MNFQEYIAKEKIRINKVTPKQIDYILDNKSYLPELDVNVKDVELHLITKDEAQEIIKGIEALVSEEIWESSKYEY